MNKSTFKPVRFFGRQGFVSTGKKSQKNIILTFPGTNIPDPFSCVRDTDSASRRAQRMVTSIKKSSTGRAPRRTRQRGQASRSSAASGDSSDDSEPERRQHDLYDQAALAGLLCISKKSVQNVYSKTPHLLPPAIAIPGARGPRWTPESVAEWPSSRPQHTTKTAPVAPRRKAGRPRIALAVKGVQS